MIQDVLAELFHRLLERLGRGRQVAQQGAVQLLTLDPQIQGERRQPGVGRLLNGLRVVQALVVDQLDRATHQEPE
ncbi:hypothetical protein D3C78_1779760 [compost metagenome]